MSMSDLPGSAVRARASQLGWAQVSRSQVGLALACAGLLGSACGVDPRNEGTTTSTGGPNMVVLGPSTVPEQGTTGDTGTTSDVGGAVPPNTAGTTGGLSGTPGGQQSIPGGSTGMSSEPEACEILRVANTRIPPDMLIVLDRSTSMRSLVLDRWGPSVSGIKRITQSLEEIIHFGLMVFPGRRDCSMFAGDPVGQLACQTLGGECLAGSLDVSIERGSAAAIASTLDSLDLVPGTPTSATLRAAHQVLGPQTTNPDQLSTSAYVLLVTDGAPNCRGGLLLGDDVQASVDAVAAMATDGVKTFVLGYDTKNNFALSSSLDRMAVAGNTGDTAHRAIEDEASLVAAFEEIAGRAVSCDYALETAPSDPSYVLVELDGAALELGAADGWSMGPDGLRVTIEGAACAELKTGAGTHDLTVTVQCEPVIVQ